MFLLRAISIFSVLALSSASCKSSSTNQTKDLPLDKINEMSLEEWTAACEAELKNPETSKRALEDLNKLAGTPKCEAAYPVIKNIFATYAKKD